MTRLEHLSRISNAVLTPHLNRPMSQKEFKGRCGSAKEHFVERLARKRRIFAPNGANVKKKLLVNLVLCWEVDMVNVNDLNNHDMSYIKTMDDVKDYLGCVISEDESFSDVQYSLELILSRLKDLNK